MASSYVRDVGGYVLQCRGAGGRGCPRNTTSVKRYPRVKLRISLDRLHDLLGLPDDVSIDTVEVGASPTDLRSCDLILGGKHLDGLPILFQPDASASPHINALYAKNGESRERFMRFAARDEVVSPSDGTLLYVAPEPTERRKAWVAHFPPETCSFAQEGCDFRPEDVGVDGQDGSYLTAQEYRDRELDKTKLSREEA